MGQRGFFVTLLLHLMPLTKQGNELVHAVGQGGRDEVDAGCVTIDQLRISAGHCREILAQYCNYASGTLCSQSIIILSYEIC